MAEPLPASRAAGPIRLGYEDYASLPEDGRRYEIIDGALHMSPAPRPWHQTVSRRIQFALYAQLELAGLGQVFDAPVDLILSAHDIVQPDLVYLEGPQAGLITDRAIEGVPALVVEILSPSTRRRDVLTKSALYQRAGVPRYWLVDPDLDRIDGLHLVAGEYAPEFTSSAPAIVTAMGVRLDLGAVFRR